MAIHRLNYLNIDPALRTQKAKEAQSHLRTILSDPTSTTEQRAFAAKQNLLMKHWAQGTLPAAPEDTDYHAIVDALEN